MTLQRSIQLLKLLLIRRSFKSFKVDFFKKYSVELDFADAFHAYLFKNLKDSSGLCITKKLSK